MKNLLIRLVRDRFDRMIHRAFSRQFAKEMTKVQETISRRGASY